MKFALAFEPVVLLGPFELQRGTGTHRVSAQPQQESMQSRLRTVVPLYTPRSDMLGDVSVIEPPGFLASCWFVGFELPWLSSCPRR